MSGSELTPNDEETLAVPGVVCVTRLPSGHKVVYTGSSAGWMVPKGIMGWTHELACIVRAEAPALVRALKATQPHEQIAPKKFPMAKRAADVSPILALTPSLAGEARQHGIRVHTIGVDRVSAGFYYFAEGGSAAPVRAQGNLIEMLAPSLGPSSTNAEIQALVDSLIDRLLRELSGGLVSELDVELANALPRFTKDGTGLEDVDIEAFDRKARQLSLESAHFDSGARELVAALAAATRQGQTIASPIALYGEARRESRPALQVKLGDKTLQLPPDAFWTVKGAPREEIQPAAAQTTPSPTPAVIAKSPAPAPIAASRDRATDAKSPAPAAVKPKAPVVSARPTSPAPAAVARAAPVADRDTATANTSTGDRPTPVVQLAQTALADRTSTTPLVGQASTAALTPAATRVITDPTPRPETATPSPGPSAPSTIAGPAAAWASIPTPVVSHVPTLAPTAPATQAGPATASPVAPATATRSSAVTAAATASATPPVRESSAERKTVSAAPLPLVRPSKRAAPKEVEPASGTSMIAVLLFLVAAAVAFLMYHYRHGGSF